MCVGHVGEIIIDERITPQHVMKALGVNYTEAKRFIVRNHDTIVESVRQFILELIAGCERDI